MHKYFKMNLERTSPKGKTTAFGQLIPCSGKHPRAFLHDGKPYVIGVFKDQSGSVGVVNLPEDATLKTLNVSDGWKIKSVAFRDEPFPGHVFEEAILADTGDVDGS